MIKLNPIHSHGQSAEKRRQTQPKRFWKENGKVSQSNSANDHHRPILGVVAFFVTHSGREDNKKYQHLSNIC